MPKKVKKVVKPKAVAPPSKDYLCTSDRVEVLKEQGYRIKKLEGKELRDKMGASARIEYGKGNLVYMVK